MEPHTIEDPPRWTAVLAVTFIVFYFAMLYVASFSQNKIASNTNEPSEVSEVK